MKRIFYNKLIRDKIPEKIEDSGAAFQVVEMSADEFEQALFTKVSEEAAELAAGGDNQQVLKELSDLLIILDEIVHVRGISAEEIKAAKRANLNKKGGFAKRLFLRWSEDNGYEKNT